jgi:hypothetical protein
VSANHPLFRCQLFVETGSHVSLDPIVLPRASRHPRPTRERIDQVLNYPIGTSEGKGALSPMNATLLAYFVLSLGGCSAAALVQTDSLDKRRQTVE